MRDSSLWSTALYSPCRLLSLHSTGLFRNIEDLKDQRIRTEEEQKGKEVGVQQRKGGTLPTLGPLEIDQ